jgi:hypothetical protein
MPIKLWRIVLFYSGVLVLLGLVGLFVDLPPAAFFGVVMIPGIIEGQRFAESGQPRPPGGAIWRASVVMAALAAGMVAVLAFVLPLLGVATELTALAGWAGVLAIDLAILFVVAIPLLRVSWGIGYGLGLRDMEKKRAKR